MIGDHVAQCAGLFVIAGATADTTGFRGSDLDVVDIVTIPDRFKHRVAEAKDENILHRIFAEIMIDAINLALLEYAGDGSVQLFCGFEIAPERLFNNDPAPMAILLREPGLAETRHDFREKGRRRGEVEKMISAGTFGG